ncbi:MAG: DUF2905 domain-containing protein [Steroidobacteraceae bacterium]
MQRVLIIAGALLILAGLAWKAIAKLPFGRLPGDLLIERPGMKIWIPITTMLVVSAGISAVAWLIRKL